MGILGQVDMVLFRVQGVEAPEGQWIPHFVR